MSLDQFQASPRDQHPKYGTCEIDPIVIQPFPTTNVYRLCAAGVERMFFGLFFVSWAIVHGLHSRAEERVKERTE